MILRVRLRAVRTLPRFPAMVAARPRGSERYLLQAIPQPGGTDRSPRGHDEEALHVMIRYGFTIRTRMGQRIENVSIIAGSQRDAERRLRQMYVQCEIVECRERSVPHRIEAANFANMMDLLSISPPTIQHHG